MERDIQQAVGLVSDFSKENQPQNTSPSIIGMVDISADGEKGALISEGGTDFIAALSGNVLGKVNIGTEKVLFFTDDNSLYLFDSILGTTTAIIYQFKDLNFSSPIQAVYTQHDGCEDVVFWNDHINPDRWFNLSRPEKFKINNQFDIDLFSLDFKATHPIISTTINEEGGRLDLGLYFPVVEYLDDFGNVLFYSEPGNDYIAIGIEKEGGYNIGTYLPQIGGVEFSPKSISVSIRNIDEEVSQVRLSMIIFRNGDGFSPTAITLGKNYTVKNNQAFIVFDGFSVNRGDFIRDVAELTAKKVIWNSSRAMCKVNNHLTRWNLKEAARDYSSYQKYASKIKMRHLTKKVKKEEGSDSRSEMGGEIKADGIIYVHKDGSLSPVFHIPATQMGVSPIVIKQYTLNIYIQDGNCKDSIYFSILYTVNGVQQREFGKLDPESNFSLNYAVSNSTITVEGLARTNIGPLESECKGTIKYKIIEENISEEAAPFNEDLTAPEELMYYNVGQFGIYYSTETYEKPINYECKNDDFWGKDANGNSLLGKQVRYRRNPDRTILPLFDEEYIYIIGVEFSNIEYPNSDIVGHYFVTSTYDTRTIAAKGMLIPYAYSQEADDNQLYSEGRYIHNIEASAPLDSRYWESISAGQLVTGNNYSPSTLANAIPSSTIFPYNFISANYLFLKELPRGSFIYQEGTYNETLVSIQDRRTNDFWEDSLPYDDLDENFKPHIFSKHNEGPPLKVDVTDSLSVAPRGVFGSLRNHSYTSSFNILLLPRKLSSTSGHFRYISIRKNFNPFPSVFNINYRMFSEHMSENAIFNGDAFVSPLDMTNISWMSVSKSGKLIKIEFEYLKEIYTESVVNTYLRHQGTEFVNQYYKGEIFGCYLFMRNKFAEPYLSGLKLRDSFPKEWYGYNKDYTPSYNLKIYNSLGASFDYCTPCQNEYPSMGIYSEVEFITDRRSAFRIYKPNNSKNLPSDRGGIIAVDYADGSLFVRTTSTCFIIKPNPQVLQADGSNIYIGTGSFLSIPENELISTDLGFGGQVHPHESSITDHGLVWVDRKRRKIILVGGSLEQIHLNGKEQFFYKRLKEVTRIAYDPDIKKIKMVCENSWSLSYDANQKVFKCFHPYIPDFIFSTANGFYSVKEKSIWKHNSEQTNRIYNKQMYHSWEIVVPHLTSFDINSLAIYTRVQERINDRWIDVKDTIKRIWVYNDNQSSGWQDLVYSYGGAETIGYENFSKAIIEENKNYRISSIYDMGNGNIPFEEVYNENQETWVDINPINVDNKAQFLQSGFTGKYSVIRMYYSSDKNRRIIFHFLNTLKQYNERSK